MITSLPIFLQDIAAHVLISESYCSNLFVRILNINFKDYYTSLKINHAIRLLICTNDSITSISEQSGFSSHTNFTNQFKNYLNLSPKQFRSQLNHSDPISAIRLKSDIEPKHFELISQFETTEQLSTETTIIDLEQLEAFQHTQSSKAFIHFKNINELFQFVLMIIMISIYLIYLNQPF